MTTAIIGCYRPHYAIEAMASLLNQTEMPYDIIAPCHGYEDKLPRSMVKVTTDRYLILGDDDKLDPTYIEKTSKLMDETGADVVSTDYQVFGENNWYGQPKEWTRENFLIDNCSPYTSLCKTHVYKELGGYASEAGPFCDWDFWWRAFEAGFKMVRLPEPLFLYRTHKQQHSQNVNVAECRAKVLSRH